MLNNKKFKIKKSIRKKKFKILNECQKYNDKFDKLMFSKYKNNVEVINNNLDINDLISKTINIINLEDKQLLINLKIIISKIHLIKNELAIKNFINFLKNIGFYFKKDSNQFLLIFWNLSKLICNFPGFNELIDELFINNLFNFYDNDILPETNIYILEFIFNYYKYYENNNHFTKEIQELFFNNFLQKLFNYFEKYNLLLKINNNEIYYYFIESFGKTFYEIYFFSNLNNINIKFSIMKYLKDIFNINENFSKFFFYILYNDFILKNKLINDGNYYNFFINNDIHNLIWNKKLLINDEYLYFVSKVYELMIINWNYRNEFINNFKKIILFYVFEINFLDKNNDLIIVIINIINSYFHYFSNIDPQFNYMILESDLWDYFQTLFIKNDYLKEQILKYYYYAYKFNPYFNYYTQISENINLFINIKNENINKNYIFYLTQIINLNIERDEFNVFNESKDSIINFYDKEKVKDICFKFKIIKNFDE